jgi:predicted RNase H-like nuclease (RuvC/YqgF family)
MFNKQIMQTVSAYCKLNDIQDVDGFIKKCFDTGFNIEKYGLLGKTLNEDEKDLKTGIVGEKQVEIEVIREIRVEVPVEVIKDISDKKIENDLNETITKKEEEIDKLSQTLDELRHNLDVPVTNDKVYLLQQTIQNLNEQIRNLKKKNEELEKQLLDVPKQVGEIPARFHGSSNLNDNLYK